MSTNCYWKSFTIIMHKILIWEIMCTLLLLNVDTFNWYCNIFSFILELVILTIIVGYWSFFWAILACLLVLMIEVSWSDDPLSLSAGSYLSSVFGTWPGSLLPGLLESCLDSCQSTTSLQLFEVRKIWIWFYSPRISYLFAIKHIIKLKFAYFLP